MLTCVYTIRTHTEDAGINTSQMYAIRATVVSSIEADLNMRLGFTERPVID